MRPVMKYKHIIECKQTDHQEVQVALGFKPIPECATLDSCVSDQGRICDFIY